MSINTDLSVDPYYDDYDETKQFNRILFRPARAVQARELTQLQTILQNQIERFGSNVYKEGTIINGVNLTSRSDINYVKLKDSSTFTDPTLYVPKADEDNIRYDLIGTSSGLRAEILSATPGFETQNPDLKTFYINYLNTGTDGQKFFTANEILRIEKITDIIEEGVVIRTEVETLSVNPVVANVDDQITGNSFGISCEEGVIYQKGHFIFVENQFIVVSKYTNAPSDISVGFIIDEFLRNSDEDSSLLDNASGFNNENAPGADRLQLVPRLAAFETGSEPEDFFTLIRFVDGEIFRLRDLTEFNVIGTEMARRTYEESGNYVVEGLGTRLEDTGSGVNVIVDPGKAYVFGREVRNISAKRLAIDPETAVQLKQDQVVGVTHEAHFSFSATDGSTLDDFLTDGTRYAMYNASSEVIGYCSISSFNAGKIYAYAIRKVEGKEADAVARIFNTPITSPSLVFPNEAVRIYSTGKSTLSSITNTKFVTRVRENASGGAVGNPITIEADTTTGSFPLSNNIIGVNSASQIKIPTSVTIGEAGNIEITFNENLGVDGWIYYNIQRSGLNSDSVIDAEGYVVSSLESNVVELGVPNVVKLLEVVDITNGEDLTAKFKLVNNQKDSYYDLSYLKVKGGETIDGVRTSLRVKFVYFKRTTTGANGYLTIDSYANVTRKNLIPRYEARDNIIYDLRNCFDFRPYATLPIGSAISPSLGASNPPRVNMSADIRISNSISIVPNSQIICDQSYYLARIDNVVVDEFGDFQLFKGSASDNPSVPELKRLYALSKVYVPGNLLSTSGTNPVKITDLSNKNYTMKDIGNIEKRIDRLNEAVSLSLLETQAKDFFVDDGTGSNRFKTGILVDACRDLTIASVLDPEFNASVDKTRTVITPSVFQFPIDMKVSTENGGLNFTQYEDIITIGNTGTNSTVLQQEFATQQRNCVTNYYNYAGRADIFPAFDVGYDNITNPAVNVEVDLSQSLLDLVDNIQTFIPLTREEEISRETEFEGIRSNRISIETIRNRVSTLTTSTTVNTQSVGNFVSDVALTPYVRSREVSIFVTGLRPGAQHYFFFEQRSVDRFVYPGVLIEGATFAARNVRKNGNAGEPVVADELGTVLAVFEIPEATFFTGVNTLEIADVSDYTSINSARTSYAKVAYRAYNFDIGRTELSATTRSVDFDVEDVITERVIQRAAPEPEPVPVPPVVAPEPVTVVPEPEPEPAPAPEPTLPTLPFIPQFFRRFRIDPIAQTFILRSSQVPGSNSAYISDIEVYFGKKSQTTGVTLEIREVINGYPSRTVVPFGRKHLTSSEVNEDSIRGTTGTRFIFDNPVKLNLEKEYCFVVIPDANSPDYLIWTAKVGGVDVNEGVAITNDWGDGVMFTSTNDSAWKSYQDEDIKFKINRYNFSTTESHVNFVPNNPEFFEIGSVVNTFRNDELVYKKISGDNTVIQKNMSKGDNFFILTSGVDTFDISDNQYVLLETITNKVLSRITSTTTPDGTTDTRYNLDTPWPYDDAPVTITAAVAGRVSLFNRFNPTYLHLYGSSATVTGNEVFQANDTITGSVSGASAVISGIVNKQVSYLQPQMLVDNTIKTSSKLELYSGYETVDLDREIDQKGNAYLLNKPRTINSLSNTIVDENLEVDFILRTSLSNNGVGATTPLLDAELSMLNVYEYNISDDSNRTSKYVSKEVVLEEGFEATGLKVLLSAYRPIGTMIDVYARLVYPTNIDVQTDWIELTNQYPNLYSNVSNTRDYREFEYNLPEGDEYSTFQVMIVMRHMTNDELDSTETIVGQEEVNRTASLFPHINDYRAISLL